MTAPQDDREAEVARIAAVLHEAIHDPVVDQHWPEGDHYCVRWATRGYDAGLRATLARTREPAGEAGTA